MQAFRDRYAQLRESESQVVAISTDPPERQARFRESLGASFAFVADSDAEITNLYGNKVPILKMAKRTSYVIDSDRRIQRIDRGRNALDPHGAITASAAC
jgi:peroxiredoxin Q/BCP